MFLVPDTHAAPRFADNPLVTGLPHIRFYAGAPLFTPEGYGLGTLCVIDTEPRTLTETQTKALERMRNHVTKLLDVRLKTRELAERNQKLDAYSYAVSHDLRAPVRAVAGFSHQLRTEHGGQLDEDGRELVTDIERAAKRMGRLIDDLLYLSCAVRAPISEAPVDLSALAGEAAAMCRREYAGSALNITVAPNMRVRGDPRLIRLALDNLIGNAAKFSARADAPSIEIGYEMAGEAARFFVRDNGVGFDMAYAAKLFEPFSRLHSTDEYPGTGIGLTTVKRVIERHGGRIWAEAEVNQGATFYFTLLTDPSPEGA
ncbi:MAG: ATP-binding protein [Rhodocyclaceae bacterium]